VNTDTQVSLDELIEKHYGKEVVEAFKSMSPPKDRQNGQVKGVALDLMVSPEEVRISMRASPKILLVAGAVLAALQARWPFF
jgi:hypothetical protein